MPHLGILRKDKTYTLKLCHIFNQSNPNQTNPIRPKPIQSNPMWWDAKGMTVDNGNGTSLFHKTQTKTNFWRAHTVIHELPIMRSGRLFQSDNIMLGKKSVLYFSFLMCGVMSLLHSMVISRSVHVFVLLGREVWWWRWRHYWWKWGLKSVVILPYL